MSEKKRSLNITNVLGAVLIIVLVALSVLLGVYIQQNTTLQNKDTQIASFQNQLATPKLVSIGLLNYTDNRSNSNAPFLHITGYVVNVGSAKANNCTIHVNAVQNGNVTALDTSATITSVDAGTYETIDLQFPYTGQALEAYTSYFTWTN
jgi:hypothetical protein